MMDYFKPHEIPKIHNAVSLIPHRSKTETDRFLKLVEEDGHIIQPVLVVEENGEMAIVDGRHRAEIAIKKQWELPYIITELSSAEISRFVIKSNLLFIDPMRGGATAYALVKAMQRDNKPISEANLRFYGYKTERQEEDSLLAQTGEKQHEIKAAQFNQARLLVTKGTPPLFNLVDDGELSVYNGWVIGKNLGWDPGVIAEFILERGEDVGNNVLGSIRDFIASRTTPEPPSDIEKMKQREQELEQKIRELEAERSSTAAQEDRVFVENVVEERKENKEHEAQIVQFQEKIKRLEQQLADQWCERELPDIPEAETCPACEWKRYRADA